MIEEKSELCNWGMTEEDWERFKKELPSPEDLIICPTCGTYLGNKNDELWQQK